MFVAVRFINVANIGAEKKKQLTGFPSSPRVPCEIEIKKALSDKSCIKKMFFQLHMSINFN